MRNPITAIALNCNFFCRSPYSVRGLKKVILTLALMLASSLSAAPAYALDDLGKCRVYNSKIKSNFAKCLEQDNLLVAKGKEPRGSCWIRRAVSLQKATDKFVVKLGVSAEECGISAALATADQVRQLFASGASLTEEQLTTLSNDSTIETIADEAREAGCEAAGGYLFAGLCFPGRRDCFREGACGAFVTDYGPYAGVTISSTGCSDTTAGTYSYNQGLTWASGFDVPVPEALAPAWCVTN